MKKNCFNCIHLEWGFGDIGDPEGFVCNKRYGSGVLTDTKESELLENLEKTSYLNKAKKCCDLMNLEKIEEIDRKIENLAKDMEYIEND